MTFAAPGDKTKRMPVAAPGRPASAVKISAMVGAETVTASVAGPSELWMKK
jgi:hypothetical protein